MSNVTLAIDDELLQKARLHAVTNRTTVNAMVRKFLEETVNGADQRAAKREATLKELRALWASSDLRITGKLPTREELETEDPRMQRMFARFAESNFQKTPSK
jgi:Arc/MetJ family transcription regulator